MPDISMCVGESFIGKAVVQCAKRETCYRHTATASHWQSFFAEAPFSATVEKPEEQACDYYWDNRLR